MGVFRVLLQRFNGDEAAVDGAADEVIETTQAPLQGFRVSDVFDLEGTDLPLLERIQTGILISLNLFFQQESFELLYLVIEGYNICCLGGLCLLKLSYSITI